MFTKEKQHAINMFKHYRNKVNNKKKYDEMQYKKQKLEANKYSPEATWKLSKKFMNWKSVGSQHKIISNNILLLKAIEVAECINVYFYKKIQDIIEGIDSMVWDPENCKKVMEHKTCKLSLKYPTRFEVLKILKNLSNSKCSAIDGLDNFIVKMSCDEIVNPLHHIITLSVMQEQFPQDWKKAKVLPLHKKR